VQNHYVRFTCPTNDGVPDRVCLDNIRIAAPIATSLVVSNAYIVPGDPAVYTNAVRVRAELTEYILDPTNVQVRAYYHIGTNQWATWSEDLDDSLGMTLIATDTNASPPVYLYETANAIPGLTPDTVVQYLVRADFGGRLHADKTSPQRFKDAFENPAAYDPLDLNETYGGGTNRTPYFIVLENPLGSVWINEINIEDWNEYYEVRGDREYVELCGPAGTSLQDWTIRFLTPVTPYPNLVTNDTYTIWNRPTLGNDTNGFGFWVLGDATNTIPYDQSFTNAADPYYGFNLPYPEGCIQLIRPIGLVEHAVSYGTSSGYFAAQYATNSGFHFAGIDNFWQDSSLGLTNTGSAYADFDWYDYAGSYTPGAINAGQELVQNNEIPTELWIDATWIDSGSVYIAFTATRDITPTAWYSTNLLQTNWWQISPAPYTGSGGSYTQWFSVMTNAPSYFYRIKGEDGL
jgi:hypothetical protein